MFPSVEDKRASMVLFYFLKYHLRTKFEMTKICQQDKAVHSTIGGNTIRMLFDITWKCACKVEWSKPSDEIIHGHSHSMDMSE